MLLVNIQQQLSEIVSRLGVPISGGGPVEDYLCSVAKGLIQFVCLHTGRGIYRSLTAEKIGIHPGSNMFKETPPFLVAGEVVTTSRMYARSVSPIQKEWLSRISPTLFTSLMEAERGPRRRGEPEADEGRRSITLVKVAQAFAAFTLLDVTIKTGRTHQIRVHLSHEGHGIVGDAKYGDFALNKALARGELVSGWRFERMFLHARRLAFDHPATGERIELNAPLPAECATLLTKL